MEIVLSSSTITSNIQNETIQPKTVSRFTCGSPVKHMNSTSEVHANKAPEKLVIIHSETTGAVYMYMVGLQGKHIQNQESRPVT